MEVAYTFVGHVDFISSINGRMYLIVVDVVESVVHDNSHGPDNNTAPEDIVCEVSDT